jgi:hypothetical protein
VLLQPLKYWHYALAIAFQWWLKCVTGRSVLRYSNCTNSCIRSMNRRIPYGTVISFCMIQPNINLANFGCADTERCQRVSVLFTLIWSEWCSRSSRDCVRKAPGSNLGPFTPYNFCEFFAVFSWPVLYRILVWKPGKKIHGRTRHRCIGA